ncbi:MAG: T9SS type A sorting domain-containing protein, partial [Chitinophagales bacterium]|nr:T9SS type A sorting domain-containing protein [Chitinophagales bacterium]
SGTYTVTVTNNGCTATASQVVTVNSATASITPSGPTTFCTGGSVVLVANGGGSYAWSTGAVTQSITASTTGTYTVTVTGAGGCTATASQAVTVNSATASITPSGPTTLCAPATVDLTASGGGTYAWSTGAATATITVSASGTYTVTVTNNGCTATASQSVTVNSATASITPSGPTTFCTGGSVVLVANGGGTYAWSTGAATQSITASATGTYTVTVTGAGGCTATASQVVTANNAPTANAGADQSICSGQSATLTATGGGTYLWSTGEATASINVSPASATIYTVTVTGVGGCTASDAVSVAVSTTPTATASNNGPVCDTRDIILSASGGSTYAWSGPNGFSSTSQTSVILSGSPQFPGVGTWTYTVTVTNGTCSATASTTITVNASPSITASSNSPVCAGSTLQLTSNYSNPTGGDIYAWAGPNGFSSSQANPTISNVSILNGGVYTLTVANQFSCTSSTTTTVTIANTPNANITSNVVCNGGIATVNLLVASAGGGSTYAWSGTGATGTGNSQTIVGLAPGLQIYTVTITTVSGCTASSTTTVNVPSCFVCGAAAGTVSVSNGCVGSPLAASVSGNNTTAGYTTQFIVTNTAGTIVYIGAAPINGLAAGNYLLHSYNYSVQPTPAPAVGGSIADYVTNANNTGCYDVSNGMAFTVAAAAPALVGTSSLSQGNGGGTSPFYYNIEVLTVEGGTIPYDFEWDNTGYVRYDIAYGDADGDGIADATITVYYSDNAFWNVTVTDAGACGNSTPVIFTNEPGAGTDLLLDITNYVITAQSGTTNNGAVNITVSGGGAGCTPYSYAWSGPNGFTATTEDISSLEYGWYSVTVTCADGSENTVGWYWVPRSRRGRSKTDGDMVGLAAMPNPFNSQTNIEFYVSQDAHTTVSVFAADGKRVAVLFSDRAVADEVYSVSLDGGSLPAGVYTVVMNTDTGEVQTYKVILTK